MFTRLRGPHCPECQKVSQFFLLNGHKKVRRVSPEDGKQQAIASKESTKDRNVLAWQVNECVYIESIKF